MSITRKQSRRLIKQRVSFRLIPSTMRKARCSRQESSSSVPEIETKEPQQSSSQPVNLHADEAACNASGTYSSTLPWQLTKSRVEDIPYSTLLAAGVCRSIPARVPVGSPPHSCAAVCRCRSAPHFRTPKEWLAWRRVPQHRAD